MHDLWARLRTHWNRTDSTVVVSNTFAFGLFIGNCWWESVLVCFAAPSLPLLVQIALAVRDRSGTLSHALIVGGVVAWLWPVGEYFVVHVFGWWGEYLAPGPKVLDTALYCVLVGWIASAYCAYVGRRTVEMGYGMFASGGMSGSTALVIGLIGENLFVGAKMWVYDPSGLDAWSVPLFVPVAYGLSFGLLPMFNRLSRWPAALAFSTLVFTITVSLGIVTGFFPR
ncbi:MAG: hypothetical protein HY706_14650 [Candidatus Hydrogenedentes bacterium]|nr:hypothetical protein [Candidatus Hydrogenedentota bacterium]